MSRKFLIDPTIQSYRQKRMKRGYNHEKKDSSVGSKSRHALIGRYCAVHFYYLKGYYRLLLVISLLVDQNGKSKFFPVSGVGIRIVDYLLV